MASFNIQLPRATRLILICGMCLLTFPRPLPPPQRSCEATGYCYVTPIGAGAKNGTDWDNAYTDLPMNLTRGVSYFLAGSPTNYRDHAFDDADNGTEQIFVYKAVDCRVFSSAAYCVKTNPAEVAGWQASFGTETAKWIPTPNPDPEIKFFPTIWHFCSDYYTVDGVTGSTSPMRPGGQGFVIGAQNNMLEGMVTIGNDGCGGESPAGLTNLSFSHMEIEGTGPMPYYQVTVTGCMYSGGNATITTASSLNGVAGDRVGGWDKSSRLRLFTNAVASAMSSTQVIVPLPMDPCSKLAWVGLDFLPLSGFEGINHANISEPVTNLSIQHCYLHDLGEAVAVYNGYYVNLSHNYLARNRATPTEHASIVQFDEGASSAVSGPITVAYNFVLDGNGTAWITHLGEPARCRMDCGTIKGYYVYGNIFTCHAGAAFYQCGSGQGVVSDNAGNNIVQDAVFYNNTIAGQIGPAGVMLLNPKSTAIVENNLFYDNGNQVRMQANGGVTHDYNTLLNSSVVYGTTCNVGGHETCIAGGAKDPFVNDAAFDFHLRADMNSAANSRKPTEQGETLPAPFNSDFDGKVRGTDGTWNRGAYEFNASSRAGRPN